MSKNYVSYKLSPNELFAQDSPFNQNLTQQHVANIRNNYQSRQGNQANTKNYGAVQLFDEYGIPRSDIYPSNSESEHQKTNSYAGGYFGHSERTGMLDLLNNEIAKRRQLSPKDSLYMAYDPYKQHSINNIRRPSSPDYPYTRLNSENYYNPNRLPDISRGDALQKLSAMRIKNPGQTKGDIYGPTTYAGIIQNRLNQEKSRISMLSEKNACAKGDGNCQQFLEGILPNNSEYGYTYSPDRSNYGTLAQVYGYNNSQYKDEQSSNLQKARENLFKVYEQSLQPPLIPSSHGQQQIKIQQQLQGKLKNAPNVIQQHNQQDYSLLGPQNYNALVAMNQPRQSQYKSSSLSSPSSSGKDVQMRSQSPGMIRPQSSVGLIEQHQPLFTTTPDSFWNRSVNNNQWQHVYPAQKRSRSRDQEEQKQSQYRNRSSSSDYAQGGRVTAPPKPSQQDWLELIRRAEQFLAMTRR